ncbi:GNAT family N-acetyltransferase [Ornithinimicrobium sp. Y1847]|uniref:GNAT family N-acetyltransferase n=1 Tax=Ornithinimicrobium sp. Y1847 TaxID=3405419 RepID=UPI003B680D12
MRRQLGRYLDCNPTDVPLGSEPGGRPVLQLDDSRQVGLSIAHSRSIVALAIAEGQTDNSRDRRAAKPAAAQIRIGLDVEEPPLDRTGSPLPSAELLRAASAVASPAEQAELASLTAIELPDLFLRWWVIKEAMVKALGTGFLEDPRALDLGVRDPRLPTQWSLHDVGQLLDRDDSSAPSPGEEEPTAPRLAVVTDTPSDLTVRQAPFTFRQNSYEVRAASRDDLPLLEHAWPSHGIHESHLARQESGDTTYLIAWAGDEPLGSGTVVWTGPLHEETRTAYPDVIELAHLQVRAEHQGRGIGTALVHAAEGLVAARGHDRVGMGVGVDNPRAGQLYERLGYRRTGHLTTTTYRYLDEDGQAHEATEQDELLVCDLRDLPSGT